MPSDSLSQAYADAFFTDVMEVAPHATTLRRSADHLEPRQPARPGGQATGRGEAAEHGAMSLHVSKLRGISFDVRAKLKRHGVTYTHQLLAVAGAAQRRREFAAQSGIEEAALARLTCRADLARIKGVGAIFADMLELLGVDRVGLLARQDPVGLHDALFTLNSAERFARRAPTPEEVHDWVMQARQLPKLVRDDA